MLQKEHPARLWTWWEACIDATVIYLGSSILVAVVLGMIVVPSWSTLFPEMEPDDTAWGLYTINHIAWLGFIPVALAAWTYRRGVFDQVFYFGFPKLSVWRFLTLILAAWAFCVFLPYGLELFMTSDLTPYELGFEYQLRSMWAPVVLVNMIIVGPFAEEVLWRGFLLPVLAKTRIGFWGATLLTSAAWGLIHLYDDVGTVSVMCTGIALCFLARETRSLWPCFIVHGAINLTYALSLLSHEAS